MTVNTKIYEVYMKNLDDLKKIDGIIEKIKREHEKLENLKKEVIKEGKYAEWEKMNTDFENSISIDKEKLKGLLESLNEILETIPNVENKFEFQKGSQKYVFSKTRNCFNVEQLQIFSDEENPTKRSFDLDIYRSL